MAGAVRWDQSKADAQIRRWAVKSLEAAAVVVVNTCKSNLSHSGTGRRVAGGGIVPHTGGRGRRIYGAFRSAAGSFPYKQTGTLRASVTYEIDTTNLVARVGTSVRYGAYLERGTRRMRAHPWLRPSFAQATPQVRRILSRPA
jgi:HK97 gp10 family phage protein